MDRYLYLLIDLLSLLGPLFYSFEKKIAYYKSWKYLVPSVIITGIFFMVWDDLFTRIGIWSFNKQYLTGIFISRLPLEEILFFFCIPFSCIFIYEVCRRFIHKDVLKNFVYPLSALLITGLIILAFLFRDRLYTCVTSILTALFLIFHIAVFRKKHLGMFYIAYLFHLIPFFIVNGLLTSFPVVLYNDSETMGIRLGTIPAEDTIYSMLLLLMNVSIFEYLRKDKVQRKN